MSLSMIRTSEFWHEPDVRRCLLTGRFSNINELLPDRCSIDMVSVARDAAYAEKCD